MNQKTLGIVFGISAGAIWALETIIGKLLFLEIILIDNITIYSVHTVKDRKNSTFLLFTCI